MPLSRGIRPVLCVLLAVATAMGSLPALGRACQCPAPATSSALQNKVETAPVACCGTCCTPRHSCCETEAAKPAVPQGCSCVSCECEAPAPVKPDSVPPPAPTNGDSLELAAAPPAPAFLIALPAEAEVRIGEAHSPTPSVDLVTLLSRLTC